MSKTTKSKNSNREDYWKHVKKERATDFDENLHTNVKKWNTTFEKMGIPREVSHESLIVGTKVVELDDTQDTPFPLSSEQYVEYWYSPGRKLYTYELYDSSDKRHSSVEKVRESGSKKLITQCDQTILTNLELEKIEDKLHEVLTERAQRIIWENELKENVNTLTYLLQEERNKNADLYK